MITFNFKKGEPATIKFNLPENQQQLLDCYLWTNKNYEIINKISVEKSSEEIYLGEKNKCRFCGKDYKVEEFKTIAHSIPEFFGNKKIFSNDECDECNNYFGKTIEAELAKFLAPIRSIGFVKGKKKEHTQNYPFTGKLNSTLKTKYADRMLYASTKTPDKSLIEDLGNNKMKFNFTDLEIDHHKIMKAMSKIALSIMPDIELQNFIHTNEWLFEKENKLHIYPVNSYGLFSITQETANTNDTLEVVLLKKKEHLDDSYPYMFIGIFFAQFTFFFPVQFSKFDNFKREEIKFCATKLNTASILFENFFIFSLANEEDKIKFNINFNMTYQNMEENKVN